MSHLFDETEGLRGDQEFGTLPNLVRLAADRHGDRPFIVDGGVTVSFRELRSLVATGMRAVMAMDIQAGERVAIWAPNSWEWIVAALSVQAAGAAIVPINTRYRAEEASHILRTAQCRLLFTVGGFLGVDYPALLADHDGAPTPEIVLMRGTSRESTTSWHAFMEGAARTDPDHAGVRLRGITPGDIADVLFTSGTTGAPKGALCTHSQALRLYRDWAGVVGLQAEDRYLIIAPFFHAFGYKAGWLAALMAGATIYPLPTFDVDAALRLIPEVGITMLPGPPALYQTLLARDDLAAHDLRSLRLAVTGAASIPVSLIERMHSRLGFDTVVTGYGLTETCGTVTMCRAGDAYETIAQTSGRPLPGVLVRVIDEKGEDAEPGEPGEVIVAGYNVMIGYLDDVDATKEAFTKRNWLRTGDIGVRDAAGNLRITDRAKDMYICGGFNVYPAEVENLIAAREDIVEVAVVGTDDERLGEVGVAFVVPRDPSAFDVDAFVGWCRDAMANFKVPRRVEVEAALPRNAGGKVQKFKLKQRLIDEADDGWGRR